METPFSELSAERKMEIGSISGKIWSVGIGPRFHNVNVRIKWLSPILLILMKNVLKSELKDHHSKLL